MSFDISMVGRKEGYQSQIVETTISAAYPEPDEKSGEPTKEDVYGKVHSIGTLGTRRYTPYKLPKPSVSDRQGESSQSQSVAQNILGSPPYILCNEEKQDGVIEDLRNYRIQGKAHVGFSGWFNYDIMAVTRPKIAVICDINPRMLEFYRVFGEILKTSTSPEEFLQQLQNTLSEKKDYFDNGFLYLLPSEASRKNGWLATQSSFEFVRQMHVEEQVIYRYMDAAAAEQEFQEIQEHFGEAAVATVYASNIYEWLENDTEKRRDAFKRNMGSLMGATSLFIDAYYPHISAKHRMVVRDGFGPPLRVTRGRLPAFVRSLRGV